MRLIALTPLLALVACSEGGEPTNNEAKAPAANQLTAGQWEITTEVVKVTQRDNAPPAIASPEGSRTSTSTCVAEADVKKPQPALFAPEGSTCTYRDIYMRGSRINATLACERPGLSGSIATAVNGSFTADTLEATAVTETSLTGEGDVSIDAKLTGKRVGPCQAAE